MLHVMDGNLFYGIPYVNVKTNEKGTRDINGNILYNICFVNCHSLILKHLLTEVEFH